MSKQFILALLISIFLISILASGSDIQLIRAAPAIIVVPDNYATIQETINGASDGETIDRLTAVRDYWPTAGWRYSTAEEQGMNSTKLEEMMEYIRNESFMLDSVVVVRNGYVVLEEYPNPRLYNQNTTHLLYSATKSFTSMLIGIALEEGYIDNVQHKLVDFFPNRSIANMDSRKQAITLENVLTMTSGLQWDEWTYPLGDPRNSVTQMLSTYDWVQYVLDRPMAHEPGTVWTYNGGGSHLLSAILNATTGISPWMYAREKLLNPLGITTGYWTTDYQGLPLGFSHLHIRPLDMAKLGFLYLNNGAWDGEQIVPTEWVDASTQAYYSVFPEIDYYYGYQWWMRPLTGYYWAWGMAGQTIAVIPDYDMVVVFTGSVTDYDPGHYLIDNYILPAATPPPIVVPDDYPTIQEAINNAADGDTVFVRAGTYYEHVVINKTVSLLGEDVSATIIDGNNTGHVLNVVSDNVNVTGFTVQNSGSTHTPTHDAVDAGICLNYTIGCTISRNFLVGNSVSGIALLNSSQNTVTCNNLGCMGWCGIQLRNSSRNTLSGNAIADKLMAIHGADSSNYNNITENVISNCTCGMCYHTSHHNNIRGNDISAIEEGLWLQYRLDFNLVAENNFSNNRVAIYLLDGPNYNNTLSKNVITGSEYGIRIENDGRYTSIVDNTIVNNRAGNDSWRAGIRLDSGSDSQIHSNTITGNNYGVLLYSSSPRVSIYNNTVADNEFGIRVASGGSSYLSVTENFIADNRGYGVGVTGFTSGSNYAVISGNTIVNNSDGIALGQYSSQNTIKYNNISENAVGFYIEYSTQNRIYGNNIVNNSLQAYTGSGSVNAWDDGYGVRGNYWSDHFSWDIFSGPYQNETGSDGIGDAPYIIDEDNVDHYPRVLFRLPADVNDDAYVGIDDLFFIAINFGKAIGQPDWNPLYDINSDNCVSIDDIYIAASYFGDSI
jgi:parallel beta-helix repeat protein